MRGRLAAAVGASGCEVPAAWADAIRLAISTAVTIIRKRSMPTLWRLARGQKKGHPKVAFGA
jgi:hypothetical protein